MAFYYSVDRFDPVERKIADSNSSNVFKTEYIIKPNILKIIVIILLAVTFARCSEEKCGCEAKPYKTVNNEEATFLHNLGLYLLEEENMFEICNLNTIPDEIQSLSEDAMPEGINVFISGDLHKGCKDKMHSMIAPAITLTEIKLPDNQVQEF